MGKLQRAALLRRFIPLGAAILGFLILGLVLDQLEVLDVSLPGMYLLLRRAGPAAPATFLGLCLLRGLFLVPAGTFTVAAGIMFGPVMGPVWALVGTVISSIPPFLISRRLGSGWVREILAKNRRDPRVARAARLVRTKGFWGVTLLRTMPFPPFDIISYIVGVLPLGLGPFALGTTLGSIPGVILLSYLGAEITQSFGPLFFALVGFVVIEGIIGFALVRKYLNAAPRPEDG